MPIYEYLCQKCHVKSSVLVRNITEASLPQCPACGSSDLVRAVSGFSYHKSPMPQISDYYKDPSNIGRWAEKRLKEAGMDMPAKLGREIEAAREGKLPKSVEEVL